MTEGEMSLEIGRFTSSYPVPPAAPARPAAASPEAAEKARNFDTVLGDVPPAPPREVRAEVDRAAEIAADLAARNRELHFSTDKDTGRVVIQVRDLDGNVIRTIPPSRVLDVMSGTAVL
jgi:flagellar protein FlaG